MRRREFLGAITGAAAARPFVVQAQPGSARRIAILMGVAETDGEGQSWARAVVEGLKDLGWTERENVHYDVRWSQGDPPLIQALASELVASRPDVIVASSSPVLATLQRATSTIPLVFANVSNPVGAGFVRSLAQPGGNATGLANYEGNIASKWLEQLKQASPSTKRVFVLLHPDAAAHAIYWEALAAAAPSLGMSLTPLPFRNATDIEQHLSAGPAEPDSGLVVLANIVATGNRKLIVRLAAQRRYPAIYPFRAFVSDGGLMSYGLDLVDAHRRAALYVDRILKGSSPAELPVQQPTRLELVINLKTAKALNLTLPETLLATADEVIE